jgi:hypothetical protein
MFISDGISGCSEEQKILGIPFRTLQRKRKQLGIPFRGTKIEANSRDSLPNPSAEEKHLGIPFRGKKREAISRNSVPNHSAEEETTQSSDLTNWFPPPWLKVILFRTSFFRGIPSHSVSFRVSELALRWNSECLGMSTFFSRNNGNRSESIPRIFYEQNSVPKPYFLPP